MALTRDQIEELRLEMKRPDHRSIAEVARDLGTTKGTIAGPSPAPASRSAAITSAHVSKVSATGSRRSPR